MDRARFKFQLAEKDQVNYPRGDEWFVFDIDEIDATVPTLEIVAWEALMVLSLDQIAGGLSEGSTLAKLRAFWIARRIAGVKEDLDLFTPQVRAATVLHLKDDDADPPALSDSADEPPTS